MRSLVRAGLIEPESLVLSDVDLDHAVRAHAVGFIHLRFFLGQREYLVGVTPDCAFASEEVAERIGRIWSSSAHRSDIPLNGKADILRELQGYFDLEYKRRCERHPAYFELGHGGRSVVAAIRREAERTDDFLQ